MFDEFVRPWIDVTAPPRVKAPTPVDKDHPEAFIEWGGPSDFTATFREKAISIEIRTDPPPEKPKRIRLKFDGGASFHEYRVEAKDDPSTYAIIRTASGFTQDSPDLYVWSKERGTEFVPGRRYHFRCTYGDEPPGEETGDGQSPPSPPEINDIGKTIHSDQWNRDHGFF